jgi:hypothetical protein
MNDSDPIVDEVRRIRDTHAAKFNYDPDAIFRDIKEQEKRSGRKYVSFAEETVTPGTALQPIVAAIPASGKIEPLQAAPAADL